jgi:MipA family protein
MNRPVLSIGFLFALVSSAQASDVTQATAAKPKFTADLGAGGIFAPKFEGSDSYDFQPVPYVALNYNDFLFASVLDGIGANLINSNGFKAGPVVNFAFPRLEKDDRAALTGLGDVDATLEAGAFASYDVSDFFSAKIDVRKGIADLGFKEGADGHDGLVANLSATFNAPPLADGSLFISGGPEITYYDDNYIETYYGVSAAQSAASGYSQYSPNGGLGKASLNATAVYLLSENFTLTGFASYSRLLGDVADSPLVRGPEGSPNQFAGGAVISYRFSR